MSRSVDAGLSIRITGRIASPKSSKSSPGFRRDGRNSLINSSCRGIVKRLHDKSGWRSFGYRRYSRISHKECNDLLLPCVRIDDIRFSIERPDLYTRRHLHQSTSSTWPGIELEALPSENGATDSLRYGWARELLSVPGDMFRRTDFAEDFRPQTPWLTVAQKPGLDNRVRVEV